MGVNVKQLANYFIGEARKASTSLGRAHILREGAAAFAQLSGDPRNVHAAKKLTAVGLEFVGAASKAQQATITDFEDLLRTTADAWEDLGQDAAFGQGDMNVAAVARDLAQADSSDEAKIVSIAPQSFNKDATLGRSVLVKYAPTKEEQAQGIVQSQTVAFWQGSKREAQAMTVDVGPTLFPTVPIPEIITSPIQGRAFASVEYGSDGNRTSAIEIDVGLGRRVTVVGNYISVIVGMDPPPIFNSSPTLTIGASIGAFAAPSQAPVTRTVYFSTSDIDPRAPGVITILKQIPPRSVQLLRPTSNAEDLPPSGGFIIISFLDIGGNGIGGLRYAIGAGAALNPFPFVVPYSAFFCLVRFDGVTPAPTQALPIYLPFQLSL